MTMLDLENARELVDFSGGQESLIPLGKVQLEGAVALHNMIADPSVGLGYLADEVGMGKTYIALGVVALMRYFNPSLRVLYICPSKNVQDKWLKEYRSFIAHNVKVSQYRIRTPDGKSAVPHISCNNVPEMIYAASSGYYADYFISKDSFSISLNDDLFLWEKRCDELQELVPAKTWIKIIESKHDVKDRYAEALNYILPTFDLIIIDEAHNFKHGFESSDRNQVLSKVLGFNGKLQPRVKNALLLSATPYDRNINQLRNQLRLVGKGNLLPDNIFNDDKENIVKHLRHFMVRRLNRIEVNGRDHTRNMYRKEHRDGASAQVQLKSDHQKLVTALVQKKVGESLNRAGDSPAFQIGMMASFESYAQTAKSLPVQFDNDDTDRDTKDAQDRNVLDRIVESYKESNLGTTLPHPKMDTVCEQLSGKLFKQNKKQIVFVRRVKSVKELKDKLDDHYSQWLESYISEELSLYKPMNSMFKTLFEAYRHDSRYKEEGISEGEYIEGKEGTPDDNQPPKNDTFFSWFFRGKLTQEAVDITANSVSNLSTPDDIRKATSSKNRAIGLIFEHNWAAFILTYQKELGNLEKLITKNQDDLLTYARKYRDSKQPKNKLDEFRACQLGFIEWLMCSDTQYLFLEPLLQGLVTHYSPSINNNGDVSLDVLQKHLSRETFYTELQKQNLLQVIFPLQDALYSALMNNGDCVALLEKLDVHSQVISLCLRTGHGIIDLYLSRLKQSPGKLKSKDRTDLLKDLVSRIKQQQKSAGFSTYQELSALADQLDHIIKVNIPEVLDKKQDERRSFLSKRLNPVSPVIGATGETYGIRSAQARKFRMPGYPLALISTNVFQEGEDLHSFCDSVVHYGLSGSPVSIEQKTGRVDRVASLTQRRFISHGESEGKVTLEDDLIQVAFPYIKESIELLQVRQLCHNLNDFIESLHELEQPTTKPLDTVNTDEALSDKSDIPSQIVSFLKSPYAEFSFPDLSEIKQGIIETHSTTVSDTVAHVKSLVEQFEQSIGEKVTAQISAAKRTGDLLFHTERELAHYQLSNDCLFEYMQKECWQKPHRTLAVETGSGSYQLYANSEMLVGDNTITQAQEIEFSFDRLGLQRLKGEKHFPQSECLLSYSKDVRYSSLQLNNHLLDVTVDVTYKPDHIALRFDIGHEALRRYHTVEVYELDGLCLLISKAVLAENIAKFGVNKDKKIVQYTWMRNKKIDVVEFLLDQEGGISGRIIHPLDNFSWEEFVYCTYTLAVEADRLEYIVDHQDKL
ncbi:DEAD/DEAH box helicase family protein [Vibrio splendidus]